MALKPNSISSFIEMLEVGLGIEMISSAIISLAWEFGAEENEVPSLRCQPPNVASFHAAIAIGLAQHLAMHRLNLLLPELADHLA